MMFRKTLAIELDNKMSSIAKLRNNKKERLQTLQKELENDKKDYTDNRFWNLQKSKETGIGSAIIRFLPDPDGKYERKTFSHSFQNPENGKWFIETCPTTVYGDREFDKCPVCEARAHYMSLGEEGKDESNLVKRKIHFVSNIYVVKDPANPENEGKVFLFKYGTKIHEKILAMVQDEFEEGNEVDVFDFDDGRDFKLKSAKGQGGWINYDNSIFGESNCFAGKSDDELEAIYEMTHKLDDLYTEKNIDSYDDLKRKFERAMGTSSNQKKDSETPKAVKKPSETKSQEKTEKLNKVEQVTIDESDDDLMDELNSMLADL